MRNVSNVEHKKARPRVLFLGMPCSASVAALQALIRADVDICAIAIPAHPFPGRKASGPIEQREVRRGDLAMAMPIDQQDATSFFNLARKHAIPVWNIFGLRAAQTVETLSSYQPDFICVACFSRRIPQTILDIPRVACLNIHPSLLPRHRGPVPIFWALRAGEREVGATIHLMDEQLDTGPIVLQEKVPIVDGIRSESLERQCFRVGGSLMVQALQGMFAQTLVGRLQDEKQATYESYPGPEDYRLVAHLCSARQVYSFVRGVASSEIPVRLEVAGQTFFARDATFYSTDVRGSADRQPEQNEICIACQDGVVYIIAAE